jgi:hypothetical protein
MVINLNCDFCSSNKLDGKGYGFLSEHEVCSIPFEECAVGLIRPWTVQVRGKPYKFEALTVIDTVTNLVKLFRIERKDSDHIMRKFAQCWLTHYPLPQHCIHDPGGEFTGQELQTLLQIVTSEMYALLPRNLNQMLCGKECTKQWEMS